MKGAIIMKTEYDISTKDKEISYICFVDNILDKLGFCQNVSGTKMLRRIIYIYIKDSFSINLKKEINNYIRENNINMSYIVFRSYLDYAITNTNKEIMKRNFKNIFNMEYDCYYLSVKYFISMIINLMERRNM